MRYIEVGEMLVFLHAITMIDKEFVCMEHCEAAGKLVPRTETVIHLADASILRVRMSRVELLQKIAQAML